MRPREFFKTVVVLLILSAVNCRADSITTMFDNKDRISFTADVTYPESISWSDTQKVFFVGSIKHGTVGTVTPDGKYSVFIKDDRLVSVLVVLVDDERKNLWIVNADPGAGDRTKAETQGKMTGVGKYDLTTGERKAYFDLGSLSEGSHLANNVILDKAGNAYVTDSFAPIIFKIDTSGKASILVQNSAFKDADGFNLNGIAYLADGHLLVGKYNSGDLFKVSLKNPKDVARVRLPSPIKGADGFHLIDAKHLIVVMNLGADKTVELESKDGWKTAKVIREVKSLTSMPSAATGAQGAIWILGSRLDTLFDPKATKVSDYVLQKF